MKGIWVLIMLILCSSTVFSSLSVDIGDNSIPYVGINPVLTYGVLDSDNVWTGDNTFLNVTILNQSILNVNNSICLDSSCINSWSIINNSYNASYVPYTGAVSNVDLNSKNLTGFQSLQSQSSTASGFYSNALGYNSQATNIYSTALGRNVIASGAASTGIGYYVNALGTASSVFGRESTASGLYSSAFGYLGNSSGNYASTFGVNNTATQSGSTAIGRDNIASGIGSFAAGWGNTASGQYSVALGYKGSCSQTGALCFNGGNMGIETSTPANKLNVVGDTNITGDLYVGDDIILTDDLTIGGMINLESNIGISQSADTLIANGYLDTVFIYNNDGDPNVSTRYDVASNSFGINVGGTQMNGLSADGSGFFSSNYMVFGNNAGTNDDVTFLFLTNMNDSSLQWHGDKDYWYMTDDWLMGINNKHFYGSKNQSIYSPSEGNLSINSTKININGGLCFGTNCIDSWTDVNNTDGFVPYSGAISDVDLGNNNITTTGYFKSGSTKGLAVPLSIVAGLGYYDPFTIIDDIPVGVNYAGRFDGATSSFGVNVNDVQVSYLGTNGDVVATDDLVATNDLEIGGTIYITGNENKVIDLGTTGYNTTLDFGGSAGQMKYDAQSDIFRFSDDIFLTYPARLNLNDQIFLENDAGVNLNITSPNFITLNTGTEIRLNQNTRINGDFYTSGTADIGKMTSNFGSTIGNDNQYFNFTYLDLGALGIYPMLRGQSNGLLGNLTAIPESLIVYDENNDGYTSIAFVADDLSDITQWNYIEDSETMTLYDGTGANSPKNLDITGNVTVEKDLIVDGNISGNNFYGGMHYHNYTGRTLTFTTIKNYYYLYFTEIPHLNGFTTNNIGFNLNSSLTTLIPGRYQLIYFAVGSGQNNHEYHIVPFINNVEYDLCEIMKKMSAGGDITPMSGNCFIDLLKGDNVSLRIADYTSSGSGTYYGGNINLLRVGDSI